MSDRNRSSASVRTLPPAERIEYFVPGGALNRALIDSAERLAEDIREVPASQLRRFYGDVVAFARRLELDKDGTLPDAAIEAQMGLLKAKSAYAHARSPKHFPEALLRFFVSHAASVKNRKDFKAFRQVFETVIAYHKFYEIKSGGRN